MQSLLNLILSGIFVSVTWAQQDSTSVRPGLKQTNSFAMAEKPSLKSLGSQIKNSSVITQLFQDSKNLSKDFPSSDEEKKKRSNLLSKIEQTWKENEALMSKWNQFNRDSEPYLRGEIDEEVVLNNVIVGVQLTILRCREEMVNQQLLAIKSDMDPWFLFASDVTYEEASLISLRLANVIRSMLFDELESFEDQQNIRISNADIEAWSAWLGQVRLSWPIDRVLITEAKKILTNKPMFTAQQMAMALQKNSYQTAAVALKNAQGPKTPELKMLEKLWREEDISSMKTEVHRLAALKIRLAKDLYIKKYSQPPARIEDLVSKNLLPSVPIDYSTGKAFTLSEAALH